MCGIFDDFDYDGLDDMDDDFIEDFIVDAYQDEYNAPEMETELPTNELNTPEPEPSKSSFFDMEEVFFILGERIAGQALDEKEQRKKKKKPKKFSAI